MTSPQDQKKPTKPHKLLIYTIIQYNPKVFVEDYRFPDGEVGTERGRDMPNVANMGKDAKDQRVACATTAS